MHVLHHRLHKPTHLREREPQVSQNDLMPPDLSGDFYAPAPNEATKKWWQKKPARFAALGLFALGSGTIVYRVGQSNGNKDLVTTPTTLLVPNPSTSLSPPQTKFDGRATPYTDETTTTTEAPKFPEKTQFGQTIEYAVSPHSRGDGVEPIFDKTAAKNDSLRQHSLNLVGEFDHSLSNGTLPTFSSSVNTCVSFSGNFRDKAGDSFSVRYFYISPLVNYAGNLTSYLVTTPTSRSAITVEDALSINSQAEYGVQDFRIDALPGAKETTVKAVQPPENSHYDGWGASGFLAEDENTGKAFVVGAEVIVLDDGVLTNDAEARQAICTDFLKATGAYSLG